MRLNVTNIFIAIFLVCGIIMMVAGLFNGNGMGAIIGFTISAICASYLDNYARGNIKD